MNYALAKSDANELYSFFTESLLGLMESVGLLVLAFMIMPLANACKVSNQNLIRNGERETRTKFQCGIQGGNEDKFLRLKTMKVPENPLQISEFSADMNI